MGIIDPLMESSPPPLEAPPLGTVLTGGYELRRFIGEGGMGMVYEALSPDESRVAVKLLNLEHIRAGDEVQVVERFKREATLAASINSRHVVTAFDIQFDEKTESLYFAMPLLEGMDLDQVLEKTSPLHPTVAVRIVLQACSGLEAAHDVGVIHRDIKPANIFLQFERGGEVAVRVLDFGIAKCLFEDSQLTASGVVMGTPHYVAPEQMLDAKRADERADVWSLGVTLYRALAGQPPFANIDHLLQLQLAVTTTDVPPLQDVAPWVDPSLAVVVHGALLRDRKNRCPAAHHFAAALEAFAEGSDQVHESMLTELPQAVRATRAKRAELPQSWCAAPPSIAPPPIERRRRDRLLGRRLADRYELLRCLGRGGMGQVYEATTDEGHRYAVKIIIPEVAGKHPTARRRFVREARVAASIDSDHVVKVVQVETDEQDDMPFIVMELLKGTDLRSLLRKLDQLPPELVARLFIQACRGIEAAHALKLVHRDIKPANLFLHQLGGGKMVVKICDFGVAKNLALADGQSDITDLTTSKGLLGSPMYMSPEQAANAKKIDLRTDIWSLGASMYEALTGKAPWSHKQAVGELILAICTEQLTHLQDRAPWVPTGLAEVVHKAMSRDPDRRFQTVGQLADALEPFAGDSLDITAGMLTSVGQETRTTITVRANPVETLPAAVNTPVTQSSAKTRKPIRWLWPLGSLVAAGVAASVYFVASAPGDAGPEPPIAPAGVTNSPQPRTDNGLTSDATAGATAHETVRVAVNIVPSTATMTVNGQTRTTEQGKLWLIGTPGQRFDVVAQHKGRQVQREVYITAEGTASVDSIDLTSTPLPTPTAASPPSTTTKPTGSTTTPTVGTDKSSAPTATSPPTSKPASSIDSPPPTFDNFDYDGKD